MSKHKPGPWFVNGRESYTKYIEARIGGGLLQEVAACGPTEQQEQQEANARLIAAAPDLLEALIAMEREKSDYMTRNNLGDPAIETTNKLARAAIAKATA